MLTLSSKLRELTETLGITNVEAAKRCGLDKRRYGHYVTGRSRPNYETLIKICKNLGTTPNLLLDFTQPTESSEIQQLVSICENMSSEEIRFLIATAQTFSKNKKQNK
jgi:transcriptional regulator with XRE-family HTH domain